MKGFVLAGCATAALAAAGCFLMREQISDLCRQVKGLRFDLDVFDMDEEEADQTLKNKGVD